MSRSSSKTGKRGPHQLRLAPATLLRARLDGLWSNPAWRERAIADMCADLDAVTKGVEPAFFLTTMLKAYQETQPATQARLDEVAPHWLRERKYVAALQEIVRRGALSDADRACALAWIAAAGGDATALGKAQQEDWFFRAYYGDDRSQGVLIILWYRDRNRQRVQGFNFLLDFNPPWDGAIKDLIVFAQTDPRSAVREYVEVWRHPRAAREWKFDSLDATQAKARVIEALNANRRGNIRLHADLIIQRDLFLRYVLGLPDAPDTPPFSADDFLALTRSGQRAEEIMHFEQTVGRRVRMEDGKELLILGSLDDDEAWDDDWEVEDEEGWEDADRPPSPGPQKRKGRPRR
ncbi:MAG: hypothetical protein FJ011_16020 [Chloroflexi bacterium]|nr:hypothetical protein [Chloroflexota bacterium]